MSKKASKSMASKSVVNKSAISKSGLNKSTAGKSSMIKKRAMEEGKSKTADSKQHPTVTINDAFGGNSGFSGLDPPPLINASARRREAALVAQLTQREQAAIRMLKGRIQERLDTWTLLKGDLAELESKEINDQRQPPPVPKYDESDYQSSRIALHDYLGKIGVEVEKLKAELKKLKAKAKESNKDLQKNPDGAPKSVQIVQMSNRKPVKKQRPWAIILAVVFGLVALVVVAVVLGVVLGSKSDDAKSTTTTTMVGKVETMPDGQTGVPGTNGGRSSSKSAPITTTTTSTAMSTTTTTPPPMSNYEIACGQVKPGEEECFVGSAPGSCNDEAVCWQMELEISGTEVSGLKFTNKTLLPTSSPPTGDRKRMCKVDDDRLGSCDNGQCIPDGRPIDKSLYEPAEWKDNCDEPNPCWRKQWRKDFVDAEKRKTCKARHCNAHDQAVIWMQHVRCHAGNGRTANETCKGLPLRLWVCQPCKSDEDRLQTHMECQGGQMRRLAEGDGCILECNSDGPWVPKASPDGFNCTIKGDDQPGHCFKGQCFPIAEVYDPVNNQLPDLEQCKDARDADKKKEAVFLRGRREAINVDFTANVRPMSEDESTQTDASKKPIEFPKESEEAKEKPSVAE